MTKPRPALSVNDALDQIKVQVGSWAIMAEALGRAERTVRNYGDPDTPEEISARDAITLDLLFRKHGGEGAPIFQCYALLLETERAEALADQTEIARRAMDAIKESADAARAAIACTLPGAGKADYELAIREHEEAIRADTSTLAALRRGAGSFQADEREAPGGVP